MGTQASFGNNLPPGIRLAILYLVLGEGGYKTAASLAAGTGSGLRTVYRDIDRLRAAGVKIEGATRLGYRLAEAPDLAPLFLTRAERTALVAVAPSALKAKLRSL